MFSKSPKWAYYSREYTTQRSILLFTWLFNYLKKSRKVLHSQENQEPEEYKEYEYARNYYFHWKYESIYNVNFNNLRTKVYMSKLFKGVYYYLAIPLNEHTIQGSTLIKGAYYLRKYGVQKGHLLFCILHHKTHNEISMPYMMAVTAISVRI